MRQPIDIASLASWMTRQSAVVLFLGLGPDEILHAQNLSVTQFSFGQSNPTYHIRYSSSPQSLVLRKKPSQVVHKSAHAIDREYFVLEYILAYNQKVLSELDNDESASAQGQNTQPSSDPLSTVKDYCIPIPQPIIYCSDISILNTEFYLMEYVGGR